MIDQETSCVNESASVAEPLGTTTEKTVGLPDNLLPDLFSLDPETGELTLTPVAQARRDRYSMQRLSGLFCSQMHAAGENVTDRVSYCGRHANGDYVGVLRDKARGGRAIFGGLRVCANCWLCPVCASIIQQRRAAECRQAIDEAERMGYTASMLTLTVPHYYGDDLSELVTGICNAWSSMKTFSSWRRLKKQIGVLGDIRAFELTHGSNGWHPHFHVIVFSKVSLNDSATEFALWCSWAAACEAQGLPTPDLEHGIDISDGDDLGTYLNKMADETKTGASAKDAGITWDSADELARGHMKRGTGRMTPFDILRAYEACGFSYRSTDEGASWLRGLWRQYALATRGRSILHWSRYLKQKLGIGDYSDSEVLEQTEAQADVFSMLASAEFVSLLKAGKRVEVLEMAELCGMKAFARFVYPYRQNKQLGFDAFFAEMQERVLNQGASVEYGQRADRDAWQAVMPVNAESAKQSSANNSAMNPSFKASHLVDEADRLRLAESVGVSRSRLVDWFAGPGKTVISGV